jgi:hypothetical protein
LLQDISVQITSNPYQTGVGYSYFSAWFTKNALFKQKKNEIMKQMAFCGK